MGELVERNHRISRLLRDRVATSAEKFGVSYGGYAGLLIKQVAIATQEHPGRIMPKREWKRYLSHAKVDLRITMPREYWDRLDGYAQTYTLHSAEAARQFLLLALDYLAKHPKAVPEDISASTLFPRKAA